MSKLKKYEYSWNYCTEGRDSRQFSTNICEGNGLSLFPFFYLSLNRETSVRDKWNSHCFYPLCLLRLSPILYSLPFNPLISIWWLEAACEVAEYVRQASEFKLNQCLCYRIQLQACYYRQNQIPTEGYHEFLNPVIPI
jgi:hypothetical protein